MVPERQHRDLDVRGRGRLGQASDLLGLSVLQGAHVGIFLGIAALVIYAIVLNRTTLGYEVRAVGHSPDAARYGGISVARSYFLAMAIAGAFAGIGGSMDVLGWEYRVAASTISLSTVGFLGIAVALLGRNTAIGTGLAALLFGALLTGTSQRNLDPEIFKPELASNLTLIIQGLVVLFVGADLLILYAWNARRSSSATLRHRRRSRSRRRERPGCRISPGHAPHDAARDRRPRDHLRPHIVLAGAAPDPCARTRVAGGVRDPRSRGGDHVDHPWRWSRRLGRGGTAIIGMSLGIAAQQSGLGNLDLVFAWSVLLGATLRYATPLAFAAMGGLFSERSGVVNIGLEGMMLMGAFFGFYGADRFGSWPIGLVCAMLAGAAMAAVHAYFCIHLRADQIVVGTGINFLALGITGYAFVDIYGDQGSPTDVPTVGSPSLDFLGHIPDVSIGSGRVRRHVPAIRLRRPELDDLVELPRPDPDVRRPVPGRRSAFGSGRSASTREPPTPSGSPSTGSATARSSPSGALAALGGAYLSVGDVEPLRPEPDWRARLHRHRRDHLRQLAPVRCRMRRASCSVSRARSATACRRTSPRAAPRRSSSTRCRTCSRSSRSRA